MNDFIKIILIIVGIYFILYFLNRNKKWCNCNKESGIEDLNVNENVEKEIEIVDEKEKSSLTLADKIEKAISDAKKFLTGKNSDSVKNANDTEKMVKDLVLKLTPEEKELVLLELKELRPERYTYYITDSRYYGVRPCYRFLSRCMNNIKPSYCPIYY